MISSRASRVTTRTLAFLAALLALVTAPRASAQEEPFVVVRDDGTIASAPPVTTLTDLHVIATNVHARLDARRDELGLARDRDQPNVVSVWTTFALAGSRGGTYYVPIANDVRGIGLESVYGGDGTFAPITPGAPSHAAMLLHNDFTAVAQAATRHHAPEAGYARYLFLLELSHLWGPSLRGPEASPDALIGFPFHWSFFLDAGGSPAGGNAWRDEGDGTFTTLPNDPATLRFSWLDLYLMGLAGRDEVPPFGVLVPEGEIDAQDPLWRAPVAARTFPWFDEAPLTIRARRDVLTIDDVIAANGERAPAHGEAPTSWSVDVVLVVGRDASDDEVAAHVASFAPFARSLEATFAEATHGRGTLALTRYPTHAPELDAGVALDAGIAPDAATTPAPSAGCGCATAAPRASSPLALLALIASIFVLRRGRRALDE